MTDIVERMRMPTAYGDDQRREAADEIERLRKDKIAWQDVAASYHAEIERLCEEGTVEVARLLMENERLRAALQALHDWNVEYARINNLFNADGSPATFHELLEARRALEPKP